MININKAKESETSVLALIGRTTWAESHGQYIDDKDNLSKYLDDNFSVAQTKLDLNNPENHFYIITVDDLPVGYAKLIVNDDASESSCQLERIYILEDFIPLKIGQQLLSFIEEQARAMGLDTLSLSVYIKNYRAIRFYEKNEFKPIGELNFMVSGKSYINTVFSKKL